MSNILLAKQSIFTDDIAAVTGDSIGPDGTATARFDVPGLIGGRVVQGTVRVDASWGPLTDGKCVAADGCTSKNTILTIVGSQLSSSKTDVRPNETVTINGNGFGEKTCVPETEIMLSDVPVTVDSESISCTVEINGSDVRGVQVSNSGQFVATITLWPDNLNDTNPTLVAGTHRLSVTDSQGFSGSIDFSIAEPTIMVTPDVAGPRDYITVTGADWPVDNPENPTDTSVEVRIFDRPDSPNGRPYTVYADNAGRFTIEHRVDRTVGIPSNPQVKANHNNVIIKVSSFSVPASTITVTPGTGQPGDTITLSASNLPVYNEVDYVEIGGTRYNDPGVNTDRDGNVTVDEVLIPGLDPGIYSVVINVQGTIAIGEVQVLAESSAAGAPAELPGAVESLSDSLVAIFHFDDVGKEWSFYDPRPEFADLNTLTEMVNGEAYWILVTETVDDVVLSNKARSLTCRGADCWNLEVW